MPHDLQAPGTNEAPDWASLYRSRGPNEVTDERPIFTGDVFEGIEVGDRPVLLQVLQHPCAIRRGVGLVDRLLMAEVTPRAPLPPAEWAKGSYKVMPLPDLRPAGSPSHFTSQFDRPQLIEPARLEGATRIACLDIRGIGLLLQRWVHHNSRVVILTSDFYEAMIGPFAEADLLEEWCMDRDELDTAQATAECATWLDVVEAEASRRDRLKDKEQRARIQREARAQVLTLNSSS